MSLAIHASNHLEPLVAQLALDLRATVVALQDPFEVLTVAVPSRGIERWVGLQLTREFGVLANVAWPFVGGALADAVAECAGETASAPGTPGWDADQLAFAVLAELPAFADDPDFSVVFQHIATDGSGGGFSPVTRRCWQLVQQIGSVLDRYATWRPNLVAQWDRGRDADAGAKWQSVLWRAVRRNLADRGIVPLYQQVARLASAQAPKQFATAPLFLVGLSQLPPVHLAALQAVARQRAVVLYALCPSEAYWADEQTKAQRRRRPASEALVIASEVHPLLLALGDLHQAFHRTLVELEADGEATVHTHFQAPVAVGAPTLLQQLQTDVLQGALPSGDLPAATDFSVRIHACATPTRQVEVLRDDLLDLLHRDPTLEWRDILVITPDMPTYAPLLTAILGEPVAERAVKQGMRPGARVAIPLAVSDQGLGAVNPVAEVMLRVLQLGNQRAAVSEIMQLAALAPLQRRFALADDACTLLRDTVLATGIHWGWHADHRADDHGQPRDSHQTWQAGLDSALLGQAFAHDNACWQGVVALPNSDSEEQEVVGNWAVALHQVYSVSQQLRAPRPMANWAVDLASAVTQLTAVAQPVAFLQHQVFDLLAQIADLAAGITAPFAADAVINLLESRLQGGGRQPALVSGKVTCCALVPLRSVPFAAVYLLGCDQASFPRAGVQPGFDLTAQQPEPGDRTSRKDDRASFLDAVLAARKYLRVLYTGRDAHTNAELPLAAPVAALLEALVPAVPGPAVAQAAARGQLLQIEPLQPFDTRLFRDSVAAPVCRSFDPALAEAAVRLTAAKPLPVVRLFAEGAAALPAADPPIATVSLAQLSAFFRDTAAAFLKRLGVHFADTPELPADDQPLSLDHLRAWHLRNDQLQALRRGEAPPTAAQLLRGAVPPGGLGAAAVADAELAAMDIFATYSAHCGDAAVGSLAVDVTLSVPDGAAARQVRLLGSVPAAGETIVHVSASKDKAKYHLALWLDHLAARATPGSAPRQALWFGSDRSTPLTLAPIASPDQARAWLGELVAVYLAGQCRPQPFWPEVSYLIATNAGESKLRAAWHGNSFNNIAGPADGPAVQALFGGDPPYAVGHPQAAETAALAALVWAPYCAHLAPAPGAA